jgi:tetratricopeptide (TPR) repeat protein
MSTHTDQSASREERARLLLEADRYTDALDEIALELRDRPYDAHLRLLASDACERLGALPEAADHLSVIIAANPEHLEANRRLAELLAELGETHGAIRCWRRLVAATHEEDSDTVKLLAIALSNDGQHDAAIDLLTNITHKHPHDGASLANLGMAFLTAGREEEALTAFMRALALDPQSAQAHCGLGLAHQKRARWEEAAVAFRATERLAPDSAVGSFNLGLTLERLGDGEGARRALLRAAALEPHDEEIQRALEPLLTRTSSTPGAPSSRDGAASIKGDLESFDLLNVLEFLRMQEKTGSLVVSAPAGVGMIRLEQGMLIGGSAPRLKRLGEVLLRRGVITREELEFALSRQRELYPGMQEGVEQDATALGAVLLREGLVDEKQLTDVLFGMILNVIGQINQWREGAFAFHPCKDSGFPIRLNVQKVVLDLMRQEDEREHLRSESTR